MNRIKLIEFYVTKTYVIPIKILLILVSVPFIINIYDTLTTNIAISGNFTFVKGEHWGYYSYLFKNFALSFLFLWLGSFGVKDKRNKKSDEKE